MSDVTVTPVRRPFTATVTPPGSKSLTNRALVLAALAAGPCRVSNVLLADDSAVMLDGLRKLGFDVAVDGTTVTVTGQAGFVPADSAELFCGNSGTTIRFLSALCALGRGTYTLDGVARMRQRPIGELVDVLTTLGTKVDYAGEPGYPPIRITADGLLGGKTDYGTAQSSQFLSAVLMAGPYARDELVVDLTGPQTSWPYVAMTMRLMDTFGVTPLVRRDPKTDVPNEIIVPEGPYAATDYAVEPDASGAAYFWAVGALHSGSRVTVAGLGGDSLQGDVAFADVLGRMGATVKVERDAITVEGRVRLTGIEADLSAIPDQAQTLGVVALFARGPTRITGVRTLRVKETDRLAAMATELTKFGAKVTVEGDDAITIDPPRTPTAGVAVDTYDDHRMAMSFALAGTRVNGVVIRDRACVNKTFPAFFEELARVTGG
jgi:3-phosphoshikimate 1-carboxyvinyltransferase